MFTRRRAPSPKKLRIAVFCTSEFSVPPTPVMKDIYAPLWLTHYLTEGLVKRGHQVTLFGGQDSVTRARLRSLNMPSLAANRTYAKLYKQVSELTSKEVVERRKDRTMITEYYDFLYLSELMQAALRKEFDVIYISLIGLRALPFAGLSPVPLVCTVHSPLVPSRKQFFSAFKQQAPQLRLVGISQQHISPAPQLFSEVIYNGINLEQFQFSATPSQLLVTAGRIVKEKGIHEAIQVAKLSGHKLAIAGRHMNDDYWEKQVKPYIGGRISFRGLLSPDKMAKLYGQAKAFIFPLEWDEPFGLVMVEALACGTPVIAFPHGSVKELVQNGKNGFIVRTVPEMVRAIQKVDSIDRKMCRQSVEDRFSLDSMTNGYERLFQKLTTGA